MHFNLFQVSGKFIEYFTNLLIELQILSITIIIIIMIIKRPTDERRFNTLGDWILVYGRRKTGKTFFIEKFTEWDEFFHVKRDRTIFSKKERKVISYETLTTLLERVLEEKRVVIDEFHRLPEDFLDFLQTLGRKGKLTLISSTLWISKNF